MKGGVAAPFPESGDEDVGSATAPLAESLAVCLVELTPVLRGARLYPRAVGLVVLQPGIRARRIRVAGSSRRIAVPVELSRERPARGAEHEHGPHRDAQHELPTHDAPLP